jgi:dTDP-4-amino-4,6-dideoxygalactose transaminase
MGVNRIRLSKSVVGQAEKDALAAVIDNGYLGMGGFVQKFEERLRDYIGARNVVCVNSGTAALHLALMAAGVGPGDEVLVQSLTYVASFQAISATGAVPVACEVLPDSCLIDLSDAASKLTGRTKAIMPVHYASRVGDIESVYEFARKHGLRVVEDAAHAFGTTRNGRKVGSSGDIVCFSFDGIKNITSGEGGAVVTGDDEIARYVMDARLLAVQKDTEKRYQGGRSWEFDVSHQGYRFHMSNLFAAIGIAQLERFEPEFKPIRQRLAFQYHSALANLPGIRLFANDYDEVVPHIFPIRVTDGKRDALREKLLGSSIECGVHYYPNHLLTFYGGGHARLPVTEMLYNELLTLPLHPEVTADEQSIIINNIREWIGA